MEFSVKFLFMDGEKLEVQIPDENVKDFVEAFGRGEVYFDKNRLMGAWIHIDKERYFSVVKNEK